MKRKIFSVMAIAAIAFVSCKKDDLNSTELGEATIEGNVWADLNLTQAGVEGVNGMTVSVTVNTQDWDQQPVAGYNYDQKVYSTTTDASGNYTLTIPATDAGYDIDIVFEDLITNRTNADGTTSVVEVTRGDVTKFIWNGATIQTQDEGFVEVITSGNNSLGTATIYGTIFMDYDIANWNAAPPANQKYNTASGQTQNDIIWQYQNANAPYGVNDNTIYNVSFDYATGDYMIQFPVELSNGNYTDVEWGFLDFQGTRIQNNMAGTVDSTVNGIWSVGGITYWNETLIDGDQFTNYDIYFNFSSF